MKKNNNTVTNIMKLFWLVCLLTCMCISITMSSKDVWAAKASSNSSKIVEITKVTYDKNATKNWREGMWLTKKKYKRARFTVYAKTASGKQVKIPMSKLEVEQLGNFMHTSNGRFKITVKYGNLKKSVRVKLNVKPTKIKIVQKAPLLEGQVLTPSERLRTTRTVVYYDNGVVIRNYKGSICKQENQIVKANTATNKKKVSVRVGKVRVSKQLNVSPIRRLEVQTISYLKFGQKVVNVNSLVRNVNAVYRNGMKKTLKNYSLSVSSLEAIGNSYPVTVKYRKLSKKTSIPVIQTETTTPKPTTPPVTPTDSPEPTTTPEPKKAMVNYISDDVVIQQKEISSEDEINLPNEDLLNPEKAQKGWKIGEALYEKNEDNEFVNSDGVSLQDAIIAMIKEGIESIDVIVVYEEMPTTTPNPSVTPTGSPSPTGNPDPTGSPSPTDSPEPTTTPEPKKAMVNYISDDVVIQQKEISSEDEINLPNEDLLNPEKAQKGWKIGEALYEKNEDNEFVNSDGVSLQDAIIAMIKEGIESIDVIVVYEEMPTTTPNPSVTPTGSPSPTGNPDPTGSPSPTATPEPKKAMLNYISDDVVIQQEEMGVEDKMNLPNEDLLNPDKPLKGWEIAGILYEKDAEGNFVNSEGTYLQETVVALIRSEERRVGKECDR